MVRNNIANALEVAKSHLYNQKGINKQAYDKNARQLDIRSGDKILFRTQNRTDKFQPVYEGPFDVLESHDEYVEIKWDGRRMKVHKNLIKKYNDDKTFPTINLSKSNLFNII